MDSTQRFSNRVTDYVKYRPNYPAALYDFLFEEFKLDAGSTVADIGCGTGKFTQPLLERGLNVVGVEPNREMREAGVQLLSGFGNFRAVDGTAENTTLPGASQNMVTAAQAFHWFDLPKARAEFARILKPGGVVCIIWNQREDTSGPIMEDYAAIVAKHAPGYKGHAESIERAVEFFAPTLPKHRTFDHQHAVDFDGLLGSLRSGSYISLEPEAQRVLAEDVKRLFDRHQRDGKFYYVYQTNLFYGTL